MEGRKPFHLDRRGRRLWITLAEEDWQLLEQRAVRLYTSVSGLIALITDGWCDEQRTREIDRQIAGQVKADLAAREGRQ